MSKSPPSQQDWEDKARTLSEALPYMRKHSGQIFVIKYGGHAMGDAALADGFARDIVLLKQVGINPIIVHGGAPQISKMLDRLGIKSTFVDGLRVTDRETLEVVEMVLSGSINKQIADTITRAGGRAIGLSGKDCRLVEARQLRPTVRDPDTNTDREVDLGFVGEPVAIDADILNLMTASQVIPVIAPIGVDRQGVTYNINSDTIAGSIAAAVGARRLLMLTDVAGVLDSEGAVIERADVREARALIDGGAVKGGMLPKLGTCIEAVEGGVGAAVIMDGRLPHALLLEAFTEAGVGTLIER